MLGAEESLNNVKTKSDTMTPEDRVSTTMELSEDVEAKVAKIKKNNAEELELLPQGKILVMYAPKCKSYSRLLFSKSI